MTEAELRSLLKKRERARKLTIIAFILSAVAMTASTVFSYLRWHG